MQPSFSSMGPGYYNWPLSFSQGDTVNEAQEFVDMLQHAVTYASQELRAALDDKCSLHTTDTDPHIAAIELAKMIVQTVDRIKPR